MSTTRLVSSLGILAVLLALSLPAAADSGWYAAADLGQSHFTGGIFDAGFPASWTRSASDSATGYRITAGYQFTSNWGVEGGYVDLGHGTVSARNPHPDPFRPDIATFADYRIGAKGLFAAGTGTWPIDEQWSLFARAGLIDGRLETREHTDGLIAPLNVTETSWKATYGVGAKWKFRPQWSLRLGWDSYRRLGASSSGQYDLSLISLGLEWHFSE